MAGESISVFLELKDRMSGALNKAGGALNRTAAMGKGLASGMGDLASSVGSMGIGAIAGLGGIAAVAYKAVDAIAELNREGIDLNKQFENTSIRIAGTLKAFNVAPTFARAQAQASGVMETIASLAAKLPGETEDYVTVFAQALPKAIAAGMSDMQKVAEFTSNYTAVATSNMVDANQAGMDLFRMLSGQAGADVRMFTVLGEKIGMMAADFNKLSAPERLAKIQDAIGAFDSQLIAAGDTFDAKAGEMESRLKEIKRLGSEFSFDQAKKSLGETNALLQDHKHDLIALTDTLTGSWQQVAGYGKQFMTYIEIAAAKFNEIVIMDIDEMQELQRKRMLESTAAERAAAARITAEQERDIERREARVGLYEAGKFEQIEALFPERMQRGLGPTGFAPPKVFNELVKLGRSRKDDIEFRNRLLDYAEFQKMDEEMLYLKITGRKSLEPEKKEKERKKRETTKPPVYDFRNSRFDIKQQFAEGFDPGRIATAFASDLGRLGEMKMASGYAPLFGGK